MDELGDTEVPSVGERLRAAREQKNLSLEDVASQTRIPRRHLESLETAQWDQLPAPTYTIGFAKSYASAIGLDRTEISDQLRAEMGGQRPSAATAEVFEPADPARTMPKWLVFGAIAAVVLLVLIMSWLNRRSLDQPGPAVNNAASATTTAPALRQSAAPAPQSAAEGPVVLTASEPVWLQIKDGGAILKEGTLQTGERYQVPATAAAPMLTTGKPQVLRVEVGSVPAPAIGQPATTVHVSLRAADLMRRGAAGSRPPSSAARSTTPAVGAH